MKKGNIVLVLIIIVALALVGIFFIKPKLEQSEKVFSPASGSKAPPTATVSTENLPAGRQDSLTWKTYQNDQYKYSFSYPNNWKVSGWDIQNAAKLEKPGMGNIWQQTLLDGPNGEHFEVLIWSNSVRNDVRQWLTWYRHEDLPLKDIPQEPNFSVATHPAWQFPHATFAKGYPVEHIIFGHQDKIFELIYKIENPNQKIYDKIISSFQTPQ